MPGVTYICQTDGECPRHGKYIYFCYQCQCEWEEENPLTTAAIAKFAAGKLSRSSVDAAKKKDRENRAAKEEERTNRTRTDSDQPGEAD